MTRVESHGWSHTSLLPLSPAPPHREDEDGAPCTGHSGGCGRGQSSCGVSGALGLQPTPTGGCIATVAWEGCLSLQI